VKGQPGSKSSSHSTRKKRHRKRRKGEKQNSNLWEAERLLRRRCLVLRRSLAILVSSATVCVHSQALDVSHSPVDRDTDKFYTRCSACMFDGSG